MDIGASHNYMYRLICFNLPYRSNTPCHEGWSRACPTIQQVTDDMKTKNQPKDLWIMVDPCVSQNTKKIWVNRWQAWGKARGKPILKRTYPCWTSLLGVPGANQDLFGVMFWAHPEMQHKHTTVFWGLVNETIMGLQLLFFQILRRKTHPWIPAF